MNPALLSLSLALWPSSPFPSPPPDVPEYQHHLVLASQKLDILLLMWSHNCSTEKSNHLPQTADYILDSAAQYSVDCLHHTGTLLAHVTLAVPL